MSTAVSLADAKLHRVISQLEKLKVSWNSRAKPVSQPDVVDISDEECDQLVERKEAASLALQKAVKKSQPKSVEASQEARPTNPSTEGLPPQAVCARAVLLCFVGATNSVLVLLV